MQTKANLVEDNNTAKAPHIYKFQDNSSEGYLLKN